MTGAAVPEPKEGSPTSAWQGGLPFTYRLTGGEALRVHLKVEQERFIARTCNVVGTLRGSRYPEQRVLLGAHHDAWGYGAADPCCGCSLQGQQIAGLGRSA
jgi:N-acetylated-alpha-linked acidic dipeptidase